MASTTTPRATGDNNIDALLKKYKWASNTVTFSFTDRFADYGSNYPNAAEHAPSYQQLNNAQQTAARQWFAQYASVSLLNLVELTGSRDRDATIRLAMSDYPRTAFAITPGSSASAGDIWFNRREYNTPEIGTYAYQGIGHEIGHALGLKHGHSIERELNDQLRNVVMNFYADSMEFSIMTARSYIGQDLNAIDRYTNDFYDQAQSLMMYDIRAIQQMYGANFNYNFGDTTYTFSTTTGEMFVDGVGQGRPGENRIFRTIWDGNGVDTYNFSNYTTNVSINLTPGGWSNLDVDGNFQRAKLSDGSVDNGSIIKYARGHVFNALQYNNDLRSLIENAVGGSGNDVIFGNRAANILDGRDGNDTIYNINSTISGYDITLGGSGDDIIFDIDSIDGDIHDGGADIDWIDYSKYDFDTGSFVIDLATSEAVVFGKYSEYINNFENVSGTRSSDTIIGSSVTNVLQGNDGDDNLQGNGGDDTLFGNAGVDTLNGGTGNDFMDGGSGNDSYVVDSLGDTVIEQLSNDIDTVVSYVNNYTLSANVENLTLADGSSAINGTGNGLGNYVQGNEFGNVLSGLAGNDGIVGYGGNDTLTGGAGYDVLSGYAGTDVLNGGTEDDELYGGAGSDTLTGGAGNDLFNFASSLDGIDTITDFVVADDVIYVEKVGFVGGLIRGFLTADQFRIGTAAQDDSDRFIYNRTTGALYFDSDGVGGIAQTQFAKLSTGLAMTNQDIYVTSIGI